MGSPVIREATADDADAIAAIYAPSVTGSATSFEAAPPDAAEMASRLARVSAQHAWLVCAREGVVVGYAYGGTHRERAAYRWSTEVSAYVRADAHRAGVGRALYTSLLALLALQGYRNAYAGIALPNPGSVALHHALGFTDVGTFRRVGWKNGAWHDVLWLERALGPQSPPDAPVPLPHLRDDPRYREALDAGIRLLRG